MVWEEKGAEKSEGVSGTGEREGEPQPSRRGDTMPAAAWRIINMLFKDSGRELRGACLKRAIHSCEKKNPSNAAGLTNTFCEWSF